GAVRDAALGRSTKDYDFVVRGVQARQLQEFLGSVGIVNLVGRTFGVYKFIPDHGYDEFKAAGFEAFDIALPRTEHAWGTGGYRDVEVQSNHELPIEEDLSRRDFTINAMALKFRIMNHELGIMEIIDPYSGMKDIEGKVIRAVGDPKERFKEDYTRMLRGLRFACELGFSIESVTLAALKAVMPRINDKRATVGQPVMSPLAEFVAPREVISRELVRAFYADPAGALDSYDESGAFEMLIPELLKMKGCPQPEEFHSEGDVWAHTRLALKNIKTQEYKNTFGDPDPHYNALLVMAVLFHDIGKPPMLKTPEDDGVDRIRFDEHDTVGAEIVREIARRLVLAIMVEGPLHVDYDKLVWLIKHHLILLHTDAEDFKASTVENIFLTRKIPEKNFYVWHFAMVQHQFLVTRSLRPVTWSLQNQICKISMI
ncbi:MAG: HD domain-containing protein, partial [Candidatus Sungbacteria bacterium]|nr:HD domain-containing protein [Candidatus Sungbacteria bacterium]